MAERKGTNNGLQNAKHKTDDRATWTALKTGNAQEGYLSINLFVAVAVLDSWFVNSSRGLHKELSHHTFLFEVDNL
jgi:hypothetical protein